MTHDISENDRTSPVGVFNYAQSYSKAAAHLQKVDLDTTHPEAVVQFLYYHAIELYLKSFLMTQGQSAEALRKKFGHNILKLSRAAAKKGLRFDDRDLEVFHLASEAVMGSRYLKTGLYRLPTIDALNRTSSVLRQSVGAVLKQMGKPVRL